jgi:hypothetical protein
MKIKSILHLGNSCYYSVQNFLCSHLLSKNLKIEIYKTIILPILLYGHESRSLTLREEVCQGEYLDLRGRKQLEVRETCIMRSFIICTL